MQVNLKLRDRIEVGALNAGDCFISSNEHKLYQVVDMMENDIFADVAVLRDDLTYVIDVQTGVLHGYPKNIIVEIVNAVISEE